MRSMHLFALCMTRGSRGWYQSACALIVLQIESLKFTDRTTIRRPSLTGMDEHPSCRYQMHLKERKVYTMQGELDRRMYSHMI